MPSGVMRGRTFLAVAMMLLNVKRSFEILLKLFGTHQSPFNDVITTTTSSSSCSHVVNLQQTLNTLNRASDIHRFRRSLALEDPVCYHALLDDIVTASVISNNKNPMNNQTKKPIFYLHLPKTGGTSLCKMAIHKGLKTPEGGQ